MTADSSSLSLQLQADITHFPSFQSRISFYVYSSRKQILMLSVCFNTDSHWCFLLFLRDKQKDFRRLSIKSFSSLPHPPSLLFLLLSVARMTTPPLTLNAISEIKVTAVISVLFNFRAADGHSSIEFCFTPSLTSSCSIELSRDLSSSFFHTIKS